MQFYVVKLLRNILLVHRFSPNWQHSALSTSLKLSQRLVHSWALFAIIKIYWKLTKNQLAIIIIYFRCDEDIFSFDDAFLDFGSYSISNFNLISVQKSCVDVPISSIDCIFNRLFSTARCWLRQTHIFSCLTRSENSKVDKKSTHSYYIRYLYSVFKLECKAIVTNYLKSTQSNQWHFIAIAESFGWRYLWIGNR